MSKVLIKLAPGKAMEVKTEGAPGGDCRLASQPYLDALKGKIISDKPTAEASLPSQSVGSNQHVGH